MHIAGKVFLGLGVVFLVIGMVMAGGGRDSLGDAGDWDPEEKSEFSGTTGNSSYNYPGGEDKIVMVRDNVRCDEFTITMTNATGENHLKGDCEDDGEKPRGWEDDPPGWYHMASIHSWEYSKGEYSIEASADYEIVDVWEILKEEGGEAVGGIMGIRGGVGLSGCGVCSLLLGGILAIVLKDPKEGTQIQQPPTV
ncbi:MAG: hypothetical protein CM1200mP32_12890 [Methanobacteriota archaeon]|nr:MAG: hypothetical protein CM1200mP32_12890 [Euryarchaeota archaeon]